jgi:hypothetical protein
VQQLSVPASAAARQLATPASPVAQLGGTTAEDPAQAPPEHAPVAQAHGELQPKEPHVWTVLPAHV